MFSGTFLIFAMSIVTVMHSTLLIFDLSGGELFLIVLAIIILFGPKQIPVIARAIGKVMYEVRTATNQIKQEVMAEARNMEETVQPAGDITQNHSRDNKTPDKELNKTELADTIQPDPETTAASPSDKKDPKDSLTKKKDS